MTDEINNQAPPTAADERNSETEILDTAAAGAATPALDDPAATPPVAATATPADDAPAIGSEEWMDKAEPAEIRDFLSGELRAEEGGPETAEKEAKAEEAPKDEGGPKADAPAAELDFKFTPDADDTIFKAEEAKYLELVDLTPEMQTILDHKNAQIEQLSSATSAFASDESVTRHMAAFDRLVEFVQDPETGRLVPDTSAVIGLWEKEYPAEMPQIIDDLLARPSTKHPGLTLLQENLKEYAGLDAAGMEHLDYFLHNGGRFQILPFVPEGIHPTLAEAFWTAANRDELTTQIEAATWTLVKDPEATQVEKDAAQSNLKALNSTLAQIQTGINATRSRSDAIQQQKAQEQTAIQHEAVDRFVGTTRGIINVIAQKSTAGLEMMDESSGRIAGLGLATLIENAFSDNDGYAKFYQDELAKEGITADWPKALVTRDRLFEAEAKIVALEKGKAHPRAIELAKRDKDGIIKELLGLAHEAGGKINAKVVSGAGKKLAKQIETAPRIAAVRPKNAGDSSRGAPSTNYEDESWTPEKLRAEARKMREADPLAMAVGGDLSGYQ